ncbi:hypothetical protein NPIL_592151 [Nephila pilipes]|uniref:Uncharacterized protein n=1 Tax=Nephila pilipes TaxID=299642 RepID=A0A8X6T1Q1_NEPPI|nr:hypothetical protein NPIL_592151 [Nephila pilipes]
MPSTTQTFRKIVPIPKMLYILVLGDHHCGKTSLIQNFIRCKGEEFQESITALGTLYVVRMNIEGKKFSVGIFDTHLDFISENDQEVWFPHIRIVIICYSITDEKSLYRTSYLADIIKTRIENPRIILVGNKMDIRMNRSIEERFHFVWHWLGYLTAEFLGAHWFLECSDKSERSAEDVFEAAVLSFLGRRCKRRWFSI